MNTLNEIRNMKKNVLQAAEKKRRNEGVKSGQSMNVLIQSAVDRKKRFNDQIYNEKRRYVEPVTIVAAISVLVIAFSSYLIHRAVFPPNENETWGYAQLDDFRKAEKFVNRFLAEGKFTRRNYFKQGDPETLCENAEKLLANYSGASAASVVVSDSEDNKGIVFKAICPKGEDAAIFYLTPSKNRFYVSGIEIDKKYADKELKLKN